MTEQGRFEPLWKAADDEQQAKERLHARQLAALDKALERSGIHPSSSAFRLARLIFHVTKNTGGVLSWTAERIAADQAMRLANGSEISHRSVQRAAQQLRRAGIMQQANQTETGRGITAAARTINWRNVAAIAEGEQIDTARATDRAIDRATASATDRATAYAIGGPLLSPSFLSPKSISNQRPSGNPGSTDQRKISVALQDVLDLAGQLFRQAGYQGDDGGIFYQAAAALAHGVGTLTEAALVDAARGCRGRSHNAPAYFRQSLRNLFHDADAWLSAVWLEPTLPGVPPWKLRPQESRRLQLRRPPIAEATSEQQRRQEVERQLSQLHE